MNKKKQYLYVLRNGQFNVFKGEVQVGYIDGITGYAIFMTDFGKSYICSLHPCTVYNSVVWLNDDNETLGREILRLHVQKKIKKLEEKLNNLSSVLGVVK
jgi:hypothetical protein